MDFSSAIGSIMQDVNDGSTEPFIIYRSSDGEWHCDYTQNQYGERYGWAEDIKEQDPLSREYSGMDFSRGSFSFVYDNVLLDRMRSEYYLSISAGKEDLSMDALASFFEENITVFSQEVIDYMTTLERPLAAIMEMCPLDMATDKDDEYYNEDLAEAATDTITNAVFERLHIQPGEPEPEKSAQGEYKELLKISVNDSDMILYENPDAEYRYKVVENRYTPYYNESGDNNIYTGYTNDYLEALEKFTKDIQHNIGCIRSRRGLSNNMNGAEYEKPVKKPSLQEKLGEAKQKAAREADRKAAEHGGKPKKRKDMEVN